MLESITEVMEALLGLGLAEDQIHPAQIFVRALVVYVVTVALVQTGSRRFLGRASVFDSIVAIMLGSIMSRAVTGSPLLQTFAAGASLILLHWLMALVSYHTSNFGSFVKGEPIQLVKDGKVQNQQMRKAHISDKDFAEALRLQVRHEDLTKIQSAYLERNGKISIIPYPRRQDDGPG